MGFIQLVDEQERLEYKFDESVIYYRRYDSKVYRDIEKRHTKKGPNNRAGEPQVKVNGGAISDDLLDYVIVGWDNIQSPIPPHEFLECSRANKLRLPANHRIALIDRANGDTDGDEMTETEKKTSSSSSDGQ